MGEGGDKRDGGQCCRAYVTHDQTLLVEKLGEEVALRVRKHLCSKKRMMTPCLQHSWE